MQHVTTSDLKKTHEKYLKQIKQSDFERSTLRHNDTSSTRLA